MKSLIIWNQITLRDTTAVDQYLREISSFELLTQEQEVELVKLIKNGDKKAETKLVQSNLRFVVSVAKQYQNRGLTLLDLINEGNIGLIKAAQKFDDTRGFKFISYAVWWIRQTISAAIHENSRIVRLPLNKWGSMNKYHKTIENFEQHYHRAPNKQELCDMLDMDDESLRQVEEILPKASSLDVNIGGDEDYTMIDIIPDSEAKLPDGNLENESMTEIVKNAISILTKREQYVIINSFGIGTTQMHLHDIGQNIGLTRERVRQIQGIALKKLRKTSLQKIFN